MKFSVRLLGQPPAAQVGTWGVKSGGIVVGGVVVVDECCGRWCYGECSLWGSRGIG